ncbi:D-aminoacyl-tRNA deacylase [Aureibacter tunicatorum]|uniref:D-aminoacyl-tRNA deacylase n=1 Tax=Aureibacter tunicatorum TaxID=866807 RepID=A0AAE3XLV0_9BACT|nr:D-aminoacyl-tRNA deacylase [Aureibacter tunicatorum]MDR6238968.1 D-tyrosyl-tRNA(Tyr) deacylase [Aureibacter tunicatorum]BDD05106.1 D-aminoacyl-tRNA deacylase [Aureibacter tunicatorum]
MIAVIQRVSEASVKIDGEVKGEIGRGLMILLGIEDADAYEDIQWLAKKIVNMRIFPDENEVMNKSLLDHEREILLISQFTLHASTKKGNRPSYIKAAKPDVAIPLYEKTIAELEGLLGRKLATGEFGADMKVGLVNDGPVTIIVDTKDRK